MIPARVERERELSKIQPSCWAIYPRENHATSNKAWQQESLCKYAIVGFDKARNEDAERNVFLRHHQSSGLQHRLAAVDLSIIFLPITRESCICGLR